MSGGFDGNKLEKAFIRNWTKNVLNQRMEVIPKEEEKRFAENMVSVLFGFMARGTNFQKAFVGQPNPEMKKIVDAALKFNLKLGPSKEKTGRDDLTISRFAAVYAGAHLILRERVFTQNFETKITPISGLPMKTGGIMMFTGVLSTIPNNESHVDLLIAAIFSSYFHQKALAYVTGGDTSSPTIWKYLMLSLNSVYTTEDKRIMYIESSGLNDRSCIACVSCFEDLARLFTSEDHKIEAGKLWILLGMDQSIPIESFLKTFLPESSSLCPKDAVKTNKNLVFKTLKIPKAITELVDHTSD